MIRVPIRAARRLTAFGDADGDGDVDSADNTAWSATQGGGGVYNRYFDADLDGDNDTFDKSAFDRNYLAAGDSVEVSGRAWSPSGLWYGYTGRQLDPETGLLHYRARAYHPTLHVFLQRDPLGIFSGPTLYGYVASSPLRFVDPLGLIERTALDWEQEANSYVNQRSSQNQAALDAISTAAHLTGAALEMAIRLNPISDVVEAITGQDIMTGEDMSTLEHAAAILVVIPGLGQLDLIKDAGKIEEAIQSGKSITRVTVKATKKAAEAAGEAGKIKRKAEKVTEAVINQRINEVKKAAKIGGNASPSQKGARGGTRWWIYKNKNGEDVVVIVHKDGSVHAGLHKKDKNFPQDGKFDQHGNPRYNEEIAGFHADGRVNLPKCEE